MRRLVALVLLAGCSSAPATTDPLAVLGDCTPPASTGRAAPVGVTLPAEATVVATDDGGVMTAVDGWVPLTPRAVRAFYEANATLLQAEDEVIEAEILVRTDTTLYYVKAAADCRDGSRLSLLIAPSEQASLVPTPSGSATPIP